ncbi:thioredoxin domain-containing protein [Chelonus insularis]|uniref:thioredoxin domain-containing protein n=1 Tax=Chelonus insularis TaxID=460826 RepID=UPI00158EE9FF|nr:thioredoxin domain-containing protein [Chelonus insularis]
MARIREHRRRREKYNQYSDMLLVTVVAFVFILLQDCHSSSSADLSLVNDEELLQYINTEKYVVVLFTKDDCPECKKYEDELINLREHLVDALSAWIVKASNSYLRKIYSPASEPALVFFRNGIPLLYDGPLDDEEISHTFINNREPLVKELIDDNFEHLTQASSGATTGDWFVMFYSSNCVECQRMGARWEAVASKLKQRINVARVNKHTTGASTARRFNIFEVPEFILFRQGKMYRYQIPKYDINSFVSFAKEWYRNAQGEKVPVPQSPFDDLTLMIANFLRENPWLMKLGSITIGVFVIVSVASKLRRKPELPEKKEK